ncbi:carboxymuconolactone decarboxylase family protein [Limibaculum sp. FT325]|uniref:carboxymuconolactone decarboxylase family protein n=1 Tax=Thermohalobaculum sediminis TaxID=2939436 RepID=UPI0020BF887A|nr:carboxymuconolactone decarboxylase family protein [Limibaculum sediminis]MCL5776387.1 carboxymuconolactone decarboxylase family protein [Limibaculum sediminis]
MPTVRPAADAGLSPRAAAVFADIRATRGSDFVNNFWRSLAALDDALLERVWGQLKAVMAAPGTLDPVTREMIYIAVSVTNGCSYCVHSHTAAARAKGMTGAMEAELLSIIALASQTNALATALAVPVDAAFDASDGPP